MNKHKLHISQFTWILLVLLSLTGCTEEIKTLFSGDEISPGEPVLFSTYMPAKTMTRALTQEQFNAKMDSFNQVQTDYKFTVTMYERGNSSALGSAVYVPTKTVENAGKDNETVSYAGDGTLILDTETANNQSLYWPSNKKEYGFEVWANKPAENATVAEDQSDATNLLAQDYVHGYGFEPIWDETSNQQVDDENALNYRTSKEWYAANHQTLGLAPGGVDEAAFYKKIPLYLQHQRSLVTIILKAGEGVKREDLIYDKAITNIDAKIFSYKEQDKTSVYALPKATTVIYGSETEGTATTQYTAIVEPYNYMTNPTEDKIAQIKLSGLTYTFSAGNDAQYTDYTNNVETAINHMNGYNLAAGKHLVITATLGKDSRQILITAYVEDWDETITTTIVDDYGKAGDPELINSRADLLTYLQSDKNKAGNVAIIVPSYIDLEKNGDAVEAWPENLELKSTLNMAGATFYTQHRVFSEITGSGNLINGTIGVGKASESTSVNAAIATTNHGTIERVHVVTQDANKKSTVATATKAGLVETNNGTITGSSSTLPVYGTEGYVGGIAAISVYSTDGGMPVIDGCTVNASVDGDDDTYGGGIVGKAVGRVSNNTYEYGISYSQLNKTTGTGENTKYNFYNIVHTKEVDSDNHQLRAYSNSWPTKLGNSIGDDASLNANSWPSDNLFDIVIDSKEELESVLKSTTYNATSIRVRVANDFDAGSWTLGHSHDDLQTVGENANVYFELDGNGKTITTDGMLFSNIENYVHDLTVSLSGDLIAAETKNVNNVETTTGGGAIAPLAYSVYGTNGKISNIQVKGGDYRIQAENPGGIVVWAYGGATIENCRCDAKIQVWSNSASFVYAGGIVACAANATITRCVYNTVDGTLYRNTATTYNGTCTDGESNKTSVELKSYFYGGILGGTAPKGIGSNIEYPSVLITDCTSRFDCRVAKSTTDSEKTFTYCKGAIVGYAEYTDASQTGNPLANGIRSGCQGNWWEETGRPLGTWLSSMTSEQVIGKRNAVTPE